MIQSQQRVAQMLTSFLAHGAWDSVSMHGRSFHIDIKHSSNIH